MLGSGIGEIRTVEPTLVVTLNAYSANDVVGGLLTIPIHSAGGGGVLRQLSIVDDADQKEPYSLYLFDQVPSTIANDAAFAPTVTDLKKVIAKIAIAALDYETLNSNAYALKTGLDVEFAVPDGNLYGYLVAGDTPDYVAATDLLLRLTFELND